MEIFRRTANKVIIILIAVLFSGLLLNMDRSASLMFEKKIEKAEKLFISGRSPGKYLKDIKWSIVDLTGPVPVVDNDYFHIEGKLKTGITEDNYRNTVLVIEHPSGKKFLFLKIGSFLSLEKDKSIETYLSKRTGFNYKVLPYRTESAPGRKQDKDDKYGLYFNSRNGVCFINPLILIFAALILAASLINVHFVLDILIIGASLIFLKLTGSNMHFIFFPLCCMLFKLKSPLHIALLNLIALLCLIAFYHPLAVFYLLALLIKILRGELKLPLPVMLAFLLIFTILDIWNLLMLPALLVFIFPGKKRPGEVTIFFWLILTLVSLILFKDSSFEHKIKKDLRTHAGNELVKHAILNGQTNFISYIFSQYYSRDIPVQITLSDVSGSVLDNFTPTDMFGMTPGPSDLRSMKRIELNGIEYDYIVLKEDIYVKKSIVGSIRAAFFKERGPGISDITRFVKISGYVFVFFMIFITLLFLKTIVTNITSIFNNLLAKICITFLFGGVVLFLIFNEFYFQNQVQRSRTMMRNSAYNFFNTVNNEAGYAEKTLAGMNIGPSQFYFENLHVTIQEGVRDKAAGWHLYEGADSRLYYTKAFKENMTIKILFRDLIFKTNRTDIMPLTIYKNGIIAFNSNIRGIVTNRLPGYLGDAHDGFTMKNEYLFFNVLQKTGTDSFLIAFGYALQNKDLNIWFFFGIYYLALLFILISAILIIDFTIKRLTVIRNAFINLRSGDHSFRIAIREPGEFGELFNDFNSMAERLEESRKKELEVEALKNLEKVAKRIAHEIKNPITPVKMLLDHLNFLYENDKQEFETIYKSSSAIINEQIEYLRSLSEDFYYYSKVSTLNKTVFDMDPFLNDIGIMYKGLLEKNGISLKMKTGPHIKIKADKNMLRHVFINIIQNSIDALKGNRGEISILISQENGRIRMVFEDNAGGVPEELLQKIFQSDYSTKKAGMGIGLTFVKNAVELHFGSVKAENTGTGLRTEILLPDL